MHLTNEARSYKTFDNATKQLDKSLALIGLTRNDVRWLVSVRTDGRFVPVIVSNKPEHMLLAVHGLVAVVN